MRSATGIARRIPLIHWLRNYTGEAFTRDLLGTAIVSFMFLPQSLAYALLAGMPVQAGIYASIIPPIGYALFGTSRVLAVGPVAIRSLMTAAILGPMAVAGSQEYQQLALVLALLSGLVFIFMGLFKLGILANLLSKPVVSGFVTASSLLIAVSQIKVVMGVKAEGTTLLEVLPQLWAAAPQFKPVAVLVGLAAIAFLLAMRTMSKKMLMAAGLSEKLSGMLSRTAPLVAAILFTALSLLLDLPAQGLATVGTLPHALPHLSIPRFDYATWRELLLPAALISIIGFVESISVGRTFAAKHREHVIPDKELIGLGAANVLAAFSSAFPVSGGFSRTIVNSDAGVQTPIATIMTAIGIAIVMTFLLPVIAHVPQAVLAATIMVAAISLVDTRVLRQTWQYSKADFVAALATILITLFESVQLGVATGVVISLLMYVYRTSRPHIAVVGLVPGTQHFRSIIRYDTLNSSSVLSVRIDENLYFANVSYLEERLTELLLERPAVRHLVLMCSGINTIDSSALDTLEALNLRLKDMGVSMHFSEVKGPVMDKLKLTDFLTQLTGKVFLTQYQAILELDPQAVATPPTL